MKRAVLFSLVVAPLLAAQTTRPQVANDAVSDTAVSIARSQDAMRQQYRQRLESLPAVGEFDRAKLLRISVRNGLLHVDWLGPAAETKSQTFNFAAGAPRAMTVLAEKRLMLTGLPGLAYMTGAPVPATSRGLAQFGWVNFDAGTDELSHAQVAFSSKSGNETVMIGGGYGPDTPFQSGMLMQHRLRDVTSIRLMLPMQLANNRPIRRQAFSAQNIFDLRDKYPLEFRKYVTVPIIQLTAKDPIQPSALEINKLFPKLKPRSDAMDKVRKALELCDSDEASQRAKGSKDLFALGDEGALAASQLPLDSLSVEQRSAVDFFLNSFSSGADISQRPREALLIDCLESDDPQVKHLAAEALHVDLNTPPDDLRLKLLPRPATQPTNDRDLLAVPTPAPFRR